MPRMLVVADDLTGAHDCAARLAAWGGPVPVVRRVEALRDAGPADARVFDAETRFLNPTQARWQCARAWVALERLGGAPWRFQKLDSTLRGNPGAEVEGLVQACAAPWVAVLPAYPRAGRQTIHGKHLVHGIPLLRTEFAQDPLSPAQVGKPQDLFAPALRLHAPLKWVQAGPARLARELRKALRARRARFVTFDCAEDHHVDSIARASLSVGGRHFAGASAFAGSLARALGGRPTPAPLSPRGLRWLVLAGSVSARSFRQLEVAEAQGVLRWALAGPRPTRSAQRRLWHRGSLALSTLRGRAELASQALRRRAEGGPAIRRLVAQALALAPLNSGAAYFLTGGHTALSFFDAYGLDRFDVVGEIQPGVALGLAHGLQGRAWAATKPGGFGAEDLFPRLLKQVGAR